MLFILHPEFWLKQNHTSTSMFSFVGIKHLSVWYYLEFLAIQIARADGTDKIYTSVNGEIITHTTPPALFLEVLVQWASKRLFTEPSACKSPEIKELCGRKTAPYSHTAFTLVCCLWVTENHSSTSRFWSAVCQRGESLHPKYIYVQKWYWCKKSVKTEGSPAL